MLHAHDFRIDTVHETSLFADGDRAPRWFGALIVCVACVYLSAGAALLIYLV
jgi:hypothetical protein